MKYIQKYKAALKLNRWPMIDYVKQAEEEQQEREELPQGLTGRRRRCRVGVPCVSRTISDLFTLCLSDLVGGSVVGAALRLTRLRAESLLTLLFRDFFGESGLLENEPTAPAEQAHTTQRQ